MEFDKRKTEPYKMKESKYDRVGVNTIRNEQDMNIKAFLELF